MTNDKKIDRSNLGKVQGGKGATPTKASSGRAAGSASKSVNVGAKRK